LLFYTVVIWDWGQQLCFNVLQLLTAERIIKLFILPSSPIPFFLSNRLLQKPNGFPSQHNSKYEKLR